MIRTPSNPLASIPPHPIIYDATRDESRYITQADVEKLELAVNKILARATLFGVLELLPPGHRAAADFSELCFAVGEILQSDFGLLPPARADRLARALARAQES